MTKRKKVLFQQHSKGTATAATGHTIDEVKAEGRTRTNSQKGDHQAEKEGQVDVNALMRARICFDSVVSVLRLYCRLDSEVTRLPLSLYVQYVIVPRIVQSHLL